MDTHVIFFVIFPYVALLIAIIGGIYRYFSDSFSYSTLSSQFLENRSLFWGSVSFHWGLLIVLSLHLFVVLFPQAWLSLVSGNVRIYAVELTGMALAIFALIGLLLLLFRRLVNPRIQVVSSPMDYVLLAALLLQIGTGIYMALTYRWGSVWAAKTVVPWFWSLVYLNPQIHFIAPLPWIAKVHFVNAFVIVLLFPFTRLVHIFTVPIDYLWRPYQLVRWNRREKAVEL